MKNYLEGKITVLFDRDYGMRIELDDQNSRNRIINIEISPENLSQALGRMAHTPCRFQISNTENIGKIQEISKFWLQLPAGTNFRNRKEIAKKVAAIKCKNMGFIPDLYFDSRDSFKEEEGLTFAWVIARRYLDPKQVSENLPNSST